MTGTITNIQHFALHDGPGIRTLVFFKGCPLTCSWCCNPESQSVKPQVRFISSRCRKCLECIANCPLSSLSLSETDIQRSFEICNKCQSMSCIENCNFDAITLSGRIISSDELTEIISRDIPFYRNSGGGVTFSGGEPLMQPAFLLDVLQKCKALGIHTAIETCGWSDKKTFQQILPYTDLFLFDLKIIDNEQHLIQTGKPAGPIHENLAFLATQQTEIIIRFPLIPGITDTPQNLEGIADSMKKNHLKSICLEPYHTLGRDKYNEHGVEYHLDHLGHYNQNQVTDFNNFFLEKQFQCEVL